jgi:hypothetical protein
MDSKLTGLMTVFFLSFALVASLVIFRVGFGTRAKEELKPSGDASLVLVYPLEIPVQGGLATITVFLRADNTRPTPNKHVTLTTSSGQISPSSLTSDAEGKVAAQFTCTSSGLAEIHAIIEDNIPVKQQVSVKCN